MPANGLKVNHNDFVALHSIGKFSEGLKCLISTGILYTCLRHAPASQRHTNSSFRTTLMNQ